MEEPHPFMTGINFEEIIRNSKDRWPQLLDEIDKGNVVPIIGPDLLVEPKIIIDTINNDKRTENLHQQIISYIAEHSNVTSKPRTFSQLVYDKDYLSNHTDNNGNQVKLELDVKLKTIYYAIDDVIGKLEKIPTINHEPSKLLKDLLETKRFPFVITTSFTPIVEQAMRDIWRHVKVLKFTNDPKDLKPNDNGIVEGDIQNENDLMQPTVFYMLGKHCKNHQKFVVTDSDMMRYCKSWIMGYGAPTRLIDALKNKYLLILGNSYSDWLYRFVWFALRTETIEMRSDYVVKEKPEETFKEFLERLETFYQEDPSEVIRRIKDSMRTRPNNIQITTTPEVYDVFISYSRSDENIAKNLYNALMERDETLRVFFDDKSIQTGSWKEAEKAGLQQCRLFVPILTNNVANEVLDDHEYRSEWKTANERSEKMGGRTFIIPFAEKGFDFYNPLNRLPDEFKKMNAYWFTGDNDIQEITNVIIQTLKNLDKLKSSLQQQKRNN